MAVRTLQPRGEAATSAGQFEVSFWMHLAPQQSSTESQPQICQICQIFLCQIAQSSPEIPLTPGIPGLVGDTSRHPQLHPMWSSRTFQGKEDLDLEDCLTHRHF